MRALRRLFILPAAIVIVAVGLLALLTAQAQAPYLDVNRDGIVNQLDLDQVRASLNKARAQAGFNENADVNGDGRVDNADLLLVSRNIGKKYNLAPVVGAGTNQTITLPAGVTLNGSVTDDGLPAGAALTTAWSKVSGPGTVTFANPAAASTSASFDQAGPYVLRLTASDTLLSAFSEVTITVNPAAPVNQAPVVGAGANQTITLPAGVTLNGSVTDDGLPAGAALTMAWSKVIGPGTVTFANPAAASTSASFDQAGPYVLRLTASDTLLSAFSEVTITVNPAAPVNQAPVVGAGANQTITLPAGAALRGTVTDDGLPVGAAVTTAWSKVSGPGTVTFANPAAASTSASFDQAGPYLLRLTASDTLLSAFSEVTITVNPAAPVNQAPVVGTGTGQTITLPAGVTLNGSVTDDGLPAGAALTMAWSKVSGPGTVTFANPAAASTTATFEQPGTYVLRLTASDTLLSAFSELTITVDPAAPINQPPTVNAGDDLTTKYPNGVTINASAVDDGLPAGAPLTLTWIRVSGPGTVTFGNASAAATDANFSSPGTYLLRLTANDSVLQANDEVTVVVQEPTPPPPPVNHAPVARPGGPYTGEVNAPLSFDGRTSSDPDGDVLTYLWDFGDGKTGTGPAPDHVYDHDGEFVVTLTVSDGRGGVHAASAGAAVAPPSDRSPPIVTLTAPREVLPGANVKVIADAIDNVAVTSVTFTVDGASAAPIADPPYERMIAVPPVVAPGSAIRVRAVGRDAAGNTGAAEATLLIGAIPDTEPPTVSLAVPLNTSPGATIHISATAQDNAGVKQVEFLAGSTLIATDASAPFEAAFAVPQSAPIGSSLPFTARAVDYSENSATAERSVLVVQAPDTTPPAVTLSAPDTVVSGGRLSLTATAADNVGVASVAFYVDGVRVAIDTEAPYQTEFALPAGLAPGALVAVEARATDFTALTASDSRTVHVTGAGQGLIVGEVYDDGSGLPLAGASLALIGTDGQGAQYSQTAVTDARGRYALGASSGQGLLRISKPAWTSVDRAVAIAAGRTVEPIDARLTRLSAATAGIAPILGGTRELAGAAYRSVWSREARLTGEAGGTATAASNVAVIVTPGALGAETAFALTPVSRQGLQGLTPLGWSPVGAVDLTPHGVSLSTPATLRVPAALALANRPVLVASWDEEAAAWRAVGVPAPAADSLTADIVASGQYVWLVADLVPMVPPQPQPGAVIGGVNASAVPDNVTAVVDPQPKLTFYKPDVHSEVRGLVTTPVPLPSGTPVLARINEAYTNAGAESHPDPFTLDLVLHQSSADGLSLGASYIVSPSLAFDPLTFERGVIGVELRAGQSDAPELTVVGVDGATIAAPTGESLAVPAGAVPDRLAISIQALTASEVGFTLPEGLELVSAVSVEITGGILGSPARLSVPRPPQIFDGTGLLLARLSLVGGASRLVLVAVGNVAGDRIVSAIAIPGVGPVLDGVRTSGRYVFVRATNLIGFASGIVLGTTGSPFNGALITAGTLPVVSLSGPSGAYVAAARTGHVLLEARDVLRSDRGSGEGQIAGAGAVIAVDLRLLSDRPRVLTIAPIDGAPNVSVATPIVITFSEPIDPASVTGANAGNISLAIAGGSSVPGAISVSGTQTIVTFRPAAALAPDASYTLTLAAGIADLSGTTLGTPVVSHFDSLDTRPPPPPAAGALAATIPGANGLTTVTGTQGTAALQDEVRIANVTRKTFTPVLLDPNGGFSVGVPASLLDKLQVEIIDRAGNKTIVALPRFTRVNADGSVSAAVDASGGRVDGPGGVAVDVEPDTFLEGAIVTIKTVSETAFPIKLTADQRKFFSFSAGFSLDFGGATPNHDVHVSIPASSEDTPQDRWVVGGMQQVGSQQIFVVADTARLIDGRIITESPPCPGVQAASVYGFLKGLNPLGLVFGVILAPGGSAVAPIVSVSQPLLGAGGGMVGLPYSVLASPSEASRLQCLPVITGRVTVTPNSQQLVIAADQVTPADREIVVRNKSAGSEFHYPRNVVEYRFRIAGSETDRYQVEVVTGGALKPVPFEVNGAAPGFVNIRVDVDRVHVSVSEVVIHNLTTQPPAETRIPRTNAEARISVAGGSNDVFEVVIINADGEARGVTPTPGTPSSPGNLVMRARPATIDPGTRVFRVDSVDQRIDSSDPNVEIPANLIVDGGFVLPFDGDLTHFSGIEVRYPIRPSEFVTIPMVRAVMTNSVTGRVIRTFDLPVPPTDEPFSLGTISGDTEPPIVVSGPPRLNSFDPTGVLAFEFSEGVDKQSAKDGMVLLDEKGARVSGTVVLTNSQRTVTFVPTAPLTMGSRFTLKLDGIKDGSGNAIAPLTLAINTSAPRELGPFTPEQVGFVRDVALLKNKSDGHPYVFTVSNDPNTLISFDVSDPSHPSRALGLITDGKSARVAVLQGAKNVVLDRESPCGGGKSFSGDLAFLVRTFQKSISDIIDSYTNTLMMFDVTNPAAPCELGVKLLTQGGSHEPVPANVVQGKGNALGVTAVATAQGVTSYTAVAQIGLMAAEVRKNIGPFSYDGQMRETLYPGDYFDVAAIGNHRLAALEYTNQTLDLFDLSLSLQQSIPIQIPGRRLAVAEAFPIDLNGNGVIDDGELRDLVFVGGDGLRIVIVDVTESGTPGVIGDIPVPAGITEIAVDSAKRRLIAGGVRPTAGNDWGLFLIDLSGLKGQVRVDRNGDGLDDRVVWQSKQGLYASGSYRALRFDAERRLVYVGAAAGAGGAGFDTWSLDSLCCDLGVEMVSARRRAGSSGREDDLVREKTALKQALSAGLTAAEFGASGALSCGVPVASVSILEQGSGACLWKGNDLLNQCSASYLPGVSDHDFEVFIPRDFSAKATCVAKALNDQFVKEDGSPREIVVDGVGVTFDDVTFFPVIKEDFEGGQLNIEPPTSSGGDATGDLGLGRQQLLLKWLLEGEYVEAPPYNVRGKSLDDILELLKTNGIPGLEGFEWSTLQQYNITKSKAFVRFKGAAAAGSAMHDLYVKQLHDAGKAGIRAVLAQMVADAAARAIVLNVRRTNSSPGDGVVYATSGCLDIHPIRAPSPPWTAKPCGTFEEYVAAAASRTTLFTTAQIRDLVHKFFRVKADIEPRIAGEAEADRFVADAANFIDSVITRTKDAYDSTIGADPQSARRVSNLASAATALAKAKKVTVHIVPKVFNKGFRLSDNLDVSMYRGDTAGLGVLVKSTRVSLAGGDERFLDFDPSPAPLPVSDLTPDDRNLLDLSRLDSSSRTPLFVLGQVGDATNEPVDVDAARGQLRWVTFTIDLLQRSQKEALRENNYNGVFYYVLDRANPVPPDAAAKPPLPVLNVGGTVLQPDAECLTSPKLEISQSILKSGLPPFDDLAVLEQGETVSLELHVLNDSGGPVENVQVCSSLTGPCRLLGGMAPFASQDVSMPYTAPLESRTIDATATVSSPQAGLFAAPPLRVIVGCEPFMIVGPESDPNLPALDVMRGGLVLRHYRVVRRDGGAAVAGAPVVATLRGPNGVTTATFTTDALGNVTTGTEQGLAIPIEAGFAAGDVVTVSLTSVNGSQVYCDGGQRFTINVADRVFTKLWTGGASVGVEGAIELGLQGKLGAGLSFSLTEAAGKGHQLVSFGRTWNAAVGVLETVAETGGRIEIGPVKAQALASVKAGFTVLWVGSDAHDFKFNPDGATLPPASNAALGRLLFQTVGRGDPSATKGQVPGAAGPPITAPFKSSEKDVIGVEGTFTPKLDAFAGFLLGPRSPGQSAGAVNYGFELGLGANVKAGVELGVEDKALTREIVTSFELKGTVELGAALGIGTGEEGPPPKPEDKIQFNKLKFIDRFKLAAKGGAVSSIKASLTQRIDTPVNAAAKYVPVKLELAFAGTKTGGLTVGPKIGSPGQKEFVSIDGGAGVGAKRTIKYTITDPAMLKAVLGSLASLTGLQTTIDPTDDILPFKLGPTNMQAEASRLLDMIAAGFKEGNVLRGANLEYEISEDATGVVSLPLGGNLSLVGVSLDLATALTLERTVSSTLEKGVIRDGRLFPIQKYAREPLVPSLPDVLSDDFKQVADIAIAAVLTPVLGRFDPVVRPNAGVPLQVRSNHTAQLDIDATNEPVPEFGVVSYTYDIVPAPSRPFAMRPQSVFGPADKPHYGIGGFHEFTPAKHVFVRPATLTMFYRDDEAAGLGEATLGIYRWNQDRLDWDFLGGVRDLAANTVTTTVDRTGLYTLGPAMPAGKMTLTAQSTPSGDLLNPKTVVTYTSNPVAMNDGQPIAEGTLFTVMGLQPSSDATPFGTMVSADEDPAAPGVQVRAHNGVIQFTIEYPAANGLATAVAFSNEGTALAIETLPLR